MIILYFWLNKQLCGINDVSEKHKISVISRNEFFGNTHKFLMVSASEVQCVHKSWLYLIVRHQHYNFQDLVLFLMS